MAKNFVSFKNRRNFALEITPRGGAVVARWAHNPKVVGSSPAPATNKAGSFGIGFFFLTTSFRFIKRKMEPIII